MQVYKFGGASVKDAKGVKNLATVLKTTGYNKTLVVVSAMGKTTNAMELVIKNYFENKDELQSTIHEVIKYHNEILLDLFSNERHNVFGAVKVFFDELITFFKTNKSPNYNYVYDQVIGFGELISTTIISHYLNEIGLENNWIDVRELIKTDNYYRRSNVNWEQTQDNITSKYDASKLNITQGFLGSDANNFTTTLGREGSDYTAAIFAYTCVSKGKALEPEIPCFIVKKNQTLISLSSLDFSYIMEENISEIFSLLHLYKMKVDVIQNSAISFSVCIDNLYNNLEKLLQHLKAKFNVTCHDNVSLYTIRHYNDVAIQELEKDKTVLLKQLTQGTVQLVTK